jgi:hypothetical protein
MYWPGAAASKLNGSLAKLASALALLLAAPACASAASISCGNAKTSATTDMKILSLMGKVLNRCKK